MDNIEFLLIFLIICILIIDFLIKKRRNEINLIGDELIKLKTKKNFYKKYLEKYFSKLIIVIVAIILIVTNPSNDERFKMWIKSKSMNNDQKIKENYYSDYFVRNNFFIFSVLQQNSYVDGSNIVIMKKKKYIGIFNSYFFISLEQEIIKK